MLNLTELLDSCTHAGSIRSLAAKIKATIESDPRLQDEYDYTVVPVSVYPEDGYIEIGSPRRYARWQTGTRTWFAGDTAILQAVLDEVLAYSDQDFEVEDGGYCRLWVDRDDQS